MDPLLLQSLIRDTRAGDRQAREALARWLLTRVLPWAGRLGGAGVDRDEVAQDVLLVALRRLGGLRNEENLEVWVFGITRRVLAAHRRRSWVRRWLGAAPPDRPDPAPGPETSLASRELARKVQGVLDLLPVAQREVLVLCEAEGRSHTEAARMLGVPEGTVKSRLRLGRARFSALLSERHPHLHEELTDA